MQPYGKPCGYGSLHSVDGLLPCVAAVYNPEGVVVRAFSAVFHYYGAAERGEGAEQLVGHAVRACADYQAVDAFCSQGFAIQFHKPVDRAVGVGVALEICQIAHPWIFAGEKCLSGFNLCGDAAARRHGREGKVIAVHAAAAAYGAVAVGAAESGVDGDFLHLPIKAFAQEVGVVAVELAHLS